MRVKILVVDDEESICEILKYNLEKEGYEVTTAYSAEEALTLDLPSFSLMIVDIMMDRLSGFDFAKRLQNSSSTENIPIIFCSALNGEDDTVMGLNIGADDYITKPFSISEVIARIRAVLRRSNVSQQISYNVAKGTYEPDITFHGLRIDRNEKLCYIDGQVLDLTPTEFSLILFFLTHRNRIHSRAEIIRAVWDGQEVTNRTVDTNMARLRKKLGKYGNHIRTRTGFGYGFKEEEQED
ncbi:MAG: response regulator transcription factor [Bacteroidales bacterium]|nr:response regulator transcription factor [Bacteroidales bacterium]MBD5228801.1 response regulator transcription factor [Bacteroidales bacterium]MBD5235211.1 response regulator transcription factor [Barnesiella sp.]MBD5246980.1 response regulator transcription factor [Barnesiella sp.]MBD5257656.1 response regulator transcription factor [Barnesiella sp.]